jgi:site-specific DNA-adenine methylase
VRDGQFNPIRDRLHADDGRMAYTPQLAAMLIYLNRTGFNGLFRLNARGDYNVPAGRYDRPKPTRAPRVGARSTTTPHGAARSRSI